MTEDEIEGVGDGILSDVDDAITDISLDEAIDVVETIITGLEARLAGLKEDQARQ